MSGRMRCLRFAGVIAVAAVGAWASDDDKSWDTKTEGAAPTGWTWVGEGEELGGPRPEEPTGIVGLGGDHEGDPTVGLGEGPEDAAGGLEQPRALVGVGVQDHQGQVEVGDAVRAAGRAWTA